MKVHQGLLSLEGIKRPVVTTGSFDGVHVGHKAIIGRLRELAQEAKGESLLITFYPHPRKVLYPDSEGKDLQMIYSQEEKIEMLRLSGLDHLLILEFTREFSMQSPEQFVKDILLDKLGAIKVVVGFNHHFGRNRQGDFAYLHKLAGELGFGVEEIPEQDIQNELVSSTKIRKALLEGNIQRANAYLDHYYFIQGYTRANASFSSVSTSLQEFHLPDPGKLIPPPGGYAIHAWIRGVRSKGVLYIQHNSREKAWVNWVDTSGNAVLAETVNVYLHKRIREFNGIHNVLDLNNVVCDDARLTRELIY